MKNRKPLLLYLAVVLLTIFFAYDFYDDTQRTVTGRTIKELRSDTIKMYKEKFDMNKAFGYLWGIKESADALTQDDSNTTNDILQVKKKGGALCIEKECYRLLGIYHKGKVPYVSFYSKKFKNGLQDFTLNERLDKTIYIKGIKHAEVVIADENSSREWKFKFFDVNATKYKPKENNETDY